MSLALINANLPTILKGVPGIAGAVLNPAQTPLETMLPLIVVEQDATNWLSFFGVSFGTVGYEWHYKVKFLLCAWGVGNLDEQRTRLEPFPARIVAELAAHLNLDGACENWDFDGNLTPAGMVPQGENQFLGFIVPIKCRERVNTTFTP